MAFSKKLLKELPTDDAMRQTLLGLLTASDQVVALTGAAYLDHALQVLLTAAFRELTTEEWKRMFDGAANGILGTTSAKIRVAYAARHLQPQQYKDLLLINDIRNVFAHSLHAVDFSNKLVEADCTKLNSYQPGGVLPEPQNAKERYLWNVLDLYHVLRNKVTEQSTAKALRGEKKA
jgi:hypothetical protein